MMVLGPPMYENAPMELISKRPSRSWIQGSEVMGESRRVWEGEGMDMEEEASCLAMCGRMGVSGAGVKVAAFGFLLREELGVEDSDDFFIVIKDGGGFDVVLVEDTHSVLDAHVWVEGDGGIGHDLGGGFSGEQV